MSTQEGTREYHSLRGAMADSCHTRMLDSSCARVIRCSPVEQMMSLARLKKQMCVSWVSSGAMQALRGGGGEEDRLRTTGGTSFFTSVSSESLTDEDEDEDDEDSVSLCGSVLTTVAPGSSMWWREWCDAVEDGSIMEEEEEDSDDGDSFFIFIFFLGRSGGSGEAVVLCGGRFICTCARVMMSCRVMPRVSRSTELCGGVVVQ
ncbi:hypothetical protein E2C01_022103 [Portunus trituberculatus]|uniref:Uncharacterized protein n=1 Tax=Portunus trituberculatus TaxID=210409 RepID=A0A5B7E4I5_PORTR|nr:hypothetical protein [Portunus trituberculatus]